MKLSQEKIELCAAWVAENGLVDNGGATIKDFCKANDITQSTYSRWMAENGDFATAIKKAKQDFSDNLEKDIVASLARAAKGYSYNKTRTEIGTDKNGKPYIKSKKTEEVHVQPNVGAAIFLLTNIAGERWKNKVQNDVNAKVDAEVQENREYDLRDVPEELIAQLADAMLDAKNKKK